MNDKQRFDKYWICMKCALAKNWKPPEHPVTVVNDLCGHCDRKDLAYLIPIIDFKRPGKVVVWD